MQVAYVNLNKSYDMLYNQVSNFKKTDMYKFYLKTCWKFEIIRVKTIRLRNLNVQINNLRITNTYHLNRLMRYKPKDTVLNP